ncbi:Telomeric repeat-binding factor 2-interacting protein 1 [Borealophlyctis nickersoniae]|nr:Telomeric repeat-binding factor 2-interacting protein 1 [Borealophlyctis nickersoniae]
MATQAPTPSSEPEQEASAPDTRRPDDHRSPRKVFVDDQGAPLKFFVARSGPKRQHVCELITRHGGEVVEIQNNAYMKLVDPNGKATAEPDAHSWEYIHDSVYEDKLLDKSSYELNVNGLPSGTKQGRRQYTAKEKQLLWEYLSRPGLNTGGNVIYREFARKEESVSADTSAKPNRSDSFTREDKELLFDLVKKNPTIASEDDLYKEFAKDARKTAETRQEGAGSGSVQAPAGAALGLKRGREDDETDESDSPGAVPIPSTPSKRFTSAAAGDLSFSPTLTPPQRKRQRTYSPKSPRKRMRTASPVNSTILKSPSKGGVPQLLVGMTGFSGEDDREMDAQLDRHVREKQLLQTWEEETDDESGKRTRTSDVIYNAVVVDIVKNRRGGSNRKEDSTSQERIVVADSEDEQEEERPLASASTRRPQTRKSFDIAFDIPDPCGSSRPAVQSASQPVVIPSAVIPTATASQKQSYIVAYEKLCEDYGNRYTPKQCLEALFMTSAYFGRARKLLDVDLDVEKLDAKTRRRVFTADEDKIVLGDDVEALGKIKDEKGADVVGKRERFLQMKAAVAVMEDV